MMTASARQRHQSTGDEDMQRLAGQGLIVVDSQ